MAIPEHRIFCNGCSGPIHNQLPIYCTVQVQAGASTPFEFNATTFSRTGHLPHLLRPLSQPLPHPHPHPHPFPPPRPRTQPPPYPPYPHVRCLISVPRLHEPLFPLARHEPGSPRDMVREGRGLTRRGLNSPRMQGLQASGMQAGRACDPSNGPGPQPIGGRITNCDGPLK
ncbi:uncharacterized protein K444DRAFT_363026 [Hyaloscypha bicolor E]|uniref:Uncharacterized protein n=1 Tax=Hyaloscypha bicolor E TaxID=1095630 RepID=A0A2J6TGJ2_9HELO|nr:uncharacterized protein K444DRAFT_363026 [Hyaloscypha bicolor E]PMD62152.1 hypothetical protein K444DRAFT_363026 [Hyaloscypha bicolor E]